MLSYETWAMWLIGLAFSFIGALSFLLFNALKSRLDRLEQNICHDDRELRNQISKLYSLVIKIRACTHQCRDK